MGRACALCTAPHGYGEEKPCIARRVCTVFVSPRSNVYVPLFVKSRAVPAIILRTVVARLAR